MTISADHPVHRINTGRLKPKMTLLEIMVRLNLNRKERLGAEVFLSNRATRWIE